MASIHHDDLSLSSCWQEFRGYSLSSLKKDLMAGMAVALFSAPQSIAFAIVAGLPPSCGLLAAIFAAFVTAAFGSSRHLVVGPSNAIAILVQSAMADILFNHYPGIDDVYAGAVALQVIVQLTCMVGVFQVLAALFKLGRLAQFVSHCVVLGYLVGTAIALVVNQSYGMLGIPPERGVSTLYHRGHYLLTHLELIHTTTAAVGLGSLVLFIILKSINKRFGKQFPEPLITLVVATLAVSMLGLSDVSHATASGVILPAVEGAGSVVVVGNTGDVESIRPILEVPFFDIKVINTLLPVAFAISLLGMLETSSVTKSVAILSGQRFSVNQELLGLGLGNLLGSVMGAMPSSGSPTRSFLNYRYGAQTRLAAMSSGVFIALTLLLFGTWVEAIPLAALAALLIATAGKVVDRKQFLLCLKATRSDAFVLLATIVSCLFFTVDIAFYIGVVLSITLYLKKASSPHLIEYVFADGDGRPALPHGGVPQNKIRVINVEGELFFGAADLFQTMLKAIAEDEKVRVIILRLKNARDLDATACLALQQLHEYLRKSDRYLIACGLKAHAWEVLCDSGFLEVIGKDNLFALDERNPKLSLQRAVRRAEQLIAKESIVVHHRISHEGTPETAASPERVLARAATREAMREGSLTFKAPDST